MLYGEDQKRKSKKTKLARGPRMLPTPKQHGDPQAKQKQQRRAASSRMLEVSGKKTAGQNKDKYGD